MREKKIKYFIYKVKGSNEEEWTHLRSSRFYYTGEETHEEVYNFNDFWEKVNNNEPTGWNCWFKAFTTLFKKEKRLITDYVLLFDKVFSVKKTGSMIQFRTEVVESPNASIKAIAEDLPHEEFIQYLKDHNIERVVM